MSDLKVPTYKNHARADRQYGMPSNEDPIIDPYQTQRASVRRGIAQFQERLQAAGHDFREPPPEPTSCCGRGCNGCVWESYDAALMFWYEDAGALLAG
jgi:Oxidoreductase-like protein, N-terminal